MSKNTLYTIGHSTLPIETFIATLLGQGIELLVDVRTVPRSRYNPQFNSEALAQSLEQQGMEYRSMKALGGLRKARADSPNTGWRNGGFRGYADYMLTDDFKQALQELMGLAVEKTTAIMCAESVPWRCHRSLIADALIVRGWEVLDIMPKGETKEHKLTAFAKVEGDELIYPSSQPSLL